MTWLVWCVADLVYPLDIVMSSWFGGGGAKTFALLLVAQFAFVAAIGIAVVRYGCMRSGASSVALVYVTLTLCSSPSTRRSRSGVVVGGDSVSRSAGDARRGACVPPHARTNSGSRRPPVPSGSVRGCPPRRVRAFEDEVRDGAQAHPGDRRRARRRVAGSARGDVLLDRVGRVRRHDRRPAGRAPARPGELVARSARDDTATAAVLLHEIRRWSSDAISSTAFSPPPLSIEMARLGSRSVSSSPRSTSRLRASSKRATRNAAGRRDLHDSAQQRLVSLGVQVRRLQLGLPRRRPALILSPALHDRIVAEVGEAIADLRQIAAGFGRPGSTTALPWPSATSRGPLRFRRRRRTRAAAARRQSVEARTSWHARRSRTPSSTRCSSR